ncbi:MAG: hypothetical protein LLG97_07960 [Deltaproteobacteria bacterium]|nr:hypothetical protein [Deltaproteobacteria bacterium]
MIQKAKPDREASMEHSNWTLKMADFCKKSCTGCKIARKKGRGFLYQFVKLESRFCPMCRAYEKVYGKKAYE